jgi:hypothetical protein
MAAAVSTDPMKQVPLTDEEVQKRSAMLAKIIGEKDKIEEQKSAQNSKWNDSIRLLEEQISTIATEVREKRAWIPTQLTGGDGMGVPDDDDNAVNPDDSVDELTQRRAKKAAKSPGKKASKRGPRIHPTI